MHAVISLDAENATSVALDDEDGRGHAQPA
jgi:hypothetical protein